MNRRVRFQALAGFRRTFRTGLLIALGFLTVTSGAQEESTLKRKLMSHPAAHYPALARNMALSGLVKVDALVAPDGTVKEVTIKGGHPVLAQAAANTVRQWKWEVASHESHELIEIRFSPPE